MASILEKWVELFPQAKPTENPSAVAGGVDGANTHESSLKGSSPWHDDDWNESHPHPMRGEGENILLGNILNPAYYGHTDDDLSEGSLSLAAVGSAGLMPDRVIYNSSRKLPSISLKNIVTSTGQGKTIRGEYRVPDVKEVSDWGDFTQEAVVNSTGISTHIGIV